MWRRPNVKEVNESDAKRSLYERILGKLPEAIIASLAALVMGCANLWITVRDHHVALGDLRADVASIDARVGGAARTEQCTALQQAVVQLQIDVSRLEERIKRREGE